MEQVSAAKSFGGTQAVYRHASEQTKTDMEFALFLPPGDGPFPLLTFLSGLTCTWENVTTKGGFQKLAAELGLAILAPDTSPRGDGVPDDPDGAYDFGLAAGFYLDATQVPWSANYRIESYLLKELWPQVAEAFPIDGGRMGLTGHSMGGHGALTLGLRNSDLFKSLSAFAPICTPVNCPWGQKALGNYLGDDQAAWLAYDACELIKGGQRFDGEILVDQGLDDPFLTEQLKPDVLQNICLETGQGLKYRAQAGYDHSYYFISTFMDDHLKHHAAALKA